MRSFIVLCFTFCLLTVNAQDFYLFVGTYTTGKSKGIYVYKFNSKNGEVEWVSNTDSSFNPSFLRISTNGKFLYAVNEISRQKAGLVAAYSFNAQNGSLTFINQQSSGSENPCHISLTKDGKWLAVANYTGGSLATFRVNDNGSIQPFTQHIVHKGKGTNPERQEKAHVHSAFFSPDEKFLLTPDLGTDQVSVYQFSKNVSKPLTPASIPFIKTKPGSGPRHLDFSPNGKYLFVLEELSGSISAFSYNNGSTKLIQTIATHPSTFNGQPGSADIHLSPDGKFLYASNRGEENNIAIFSVDAITGKLILVGYQPTKGEHPRNFMIDPTGNYLLVANKNTNNIVVFKRDKITGLLQETLQQIEVPNPVCLQMLRK